ncbi:hypothetical protein L484_002747 [Morus notabilis]|uniref:Uncharacterized protein n=1 Tax=Morus notabilis TaxID=981085 RepID=W9QBH1_9ROSA|nr:hypothetical protein L484_002747 [Morus notabilis]
MQALRSSLAYFQIFKEQTCKTPWMSASDVQIPSGVQTPHSQIPANEDDMQIPPGNDELERSIPEEAQPWMRGERLRDKRRYKEARTVVIF